MHKKILIMGLPGAGKTTLAKQLALRLNAVHFNADDVRANVSKDLGFSEPDRVEQARRMGWLCNQVVKVGCFAIADFICPTPATRAAFLHGGEAFVIWLDRIQVGTFADTNRMFVPPDRFDLRVTAHGPPEYWAEQAMVRLRPVFDPKNRRRCSLAAISRFTRGIGRSSSRGCNASARPASQCATRKALTTKIRSILSTSRRASSTACAKFEGRYAVVPLPNISHVFYGRDVGYAVERIDLNLAIENISAAELRRKLATAH